MCLDSKLRFRIFQTVRVGDSLVRDLTVHHVDAADERGLFLARVGEAEVGEQFDVAMRDVR